jgi:formylglycine-generating enzyme required for sulfatase activity
MAGNVWEWVQDCYHIDYDGAPADGSAWTNGNATVPSTAEMNCSSHEIRGAAWSSDPQDLNAAYRNSALSDKRYNNLGFRVGMTLTR